MYVVLLQICISNYFMFRILKKFSLNKYSFVIVVTLILKSKTNSFYKSYIFIVQKKNILVPV